MYTNKSIRLLEKCTKIMALIQRVNNKINTLKARLAAYENNPAFVYGGKRTLEIHIENNEFIIQRLTRYYSKTVTQLSDEALKQCFPKLEIAS